MVSRTTVRNAVVAAALLVGAGGQTGCAKPEAVRCPLGNFCPPGWECAAKEAVCINTPCGNDRVDPGEACDDGNIRDRDGCSADCKSNEKCGNGITDKIVGEVCDYNDPAYANGGCSQNCMSTLACGNGIVDQDKDPPEECDHGNGNSATGDCLPGSCKWNVCGDGFVNETPVDPLVPAVHEEDCDTGPDSVSQKHDCAYGQAVSQVLCSQCKHVSCDVHYCGDGNLDEGHEACDDGNTITEGSCPYGQATCTVCSATCALVSRSGHYCGDGTVEDPEACDAIASFACGTCGSPGSASGGCSREGRSAAAGTLTVVSTALAGVTFTLSHEVNGTPTTFELVTGDTASGGHVPIRITSSSGDTLAGGAIAARIANAVHAQSGLRVDASHSGDALVVELWNLDEGVNGNVPIRTSDSRKIGVVGMESGRGCSAGQQCFEDADCVAPHQCTSGFCQ